MTNLHAASNSIFFRSQPASFEPRSELLGFVVRGRHEDRSSLSPEGFAQGRFLGLATGQGEGARPPAGSAPHHDPENGSFGAAGSSEIDAQPHLSADPSSGLRKTARRAPKTMCRNVASVPAAACANREKPKPRRLDGRKGEL